MMPASLRVCSGRPIAHVAKEMGISRPTAYKWVRRWRAEGEAGLYDRSSRPYATPLGTPPAGEEQVCELCRSRKLGPARIGPILGMPASTVHRVLLRHGLNRLAFMDRPTGQVIRRYERERPGELVHVDVKKLGRIPEGGGHRVLGRQAGRATRKSMGFDYVHSAVDDHTRLAYSEIHADEKDATCAGFLRRAAAFFTTLGITRIERVLTDNAWSYRKSFAWRQALAELGPPADSPAPTDRRPTARSNASTAPCSTNGPTNALTPAIPNEAHPCQTSSTPTTTTDATPHSQASPPSPAQTTLQGNTPSAQRAGGRRGAGMVAL